jgi:N-dimethylarginine dimethylaminohydrolase
MPQAAAEHEAFRGAPRGCRGEVVVSSHDPGNPDAIYVYDPVLVGGEGAVLLRPGKEGRRGEPGAIADALVAADVPIAAELVSPVVAEGGDTVWLDAETLLVGIGYRTNPPRSARSRARSRVCRC